MTTNTFLMQLQAWVSGPFILMIALFLMIAPFVVSLVVNLGRRAPEGNRVPVRVQPVQTRARLGSLDSEMPGRNKRIAL